MRVRAQILAVTCGALLLGAMLMPPQVFAQGYIAFGIGRGPIVYGPWYGGYARYPPYYARVRPYYSPYREFESALRLQVRPREAEVFVDGYFAGLVDDFDGVFQRLYVEPGEHDIELYLPGYRSVHQQIYLQPGRTSHLRLTMQPLAPGDPEPIRPSGVPLSSAREAPDPAGPRRPLPPRRPGAPADAIDPDPEPIAAPAYGSLSIRVQPGDATIVIDGDRWEGSTEEQRLVVQLAEGSHVVEVRRDGYRDYLTEVTVREGEAATLNVALTPE